MSIDYRINRPNAQRIVELERENKRLRDALEIQEIESRQTKEIQEIAEDKILCEFNQLKRTNEELLAKVARLENSLQTGNTSSRPNPQEPETTEARSELKTLQRKLAKLKKEIGYLRDLEYELQSSVLNTQRFLLSRKGIYSAQTDVNEVDSPETEKCICSEIIDRIDLLDALIVRVRRCLFSGHIADQLMILKASFLDLLSNHRIAPYCLETGSQVTLETRNKIILVARDEVDDPKLKTISERIEKNTVLTTLHPGYIYRMGSQDEVIRKADVVLNN